MAVLLRFDDSLCPLFRRRPQPYGKGRTDAERARNLEPPAVAVEDVLDDRQTEPGAPKLARTGGVDAVEPLGQPRQMIAWNAVAAVGDGDPHERASPARPLGGARGDRDL